MLKQESVVSKGRGRAYTGSCVVVTSFHSWKHRHFSRTFQARFLWHCSYCSNTTEASQSTVSALTSVVALHREWTFKQPSQAAMTAVCELCAFCKLTKLNCIVCPHAEQNNFLAGRMLFPFVLFSCPFNRSCLSVNLSLNRVFMICSWKKKCHSSKFPLTSIKVYTLCSVRLEPIKIRKRVVADGKPALLNKCWQTSGTKKQIAFCA